ncbi:MAG: hypothetical protein J5I93_11590 [Pirellulaceae bacterium]|nr:hypothetical protein [Pirellulaceae bacterium]
MASRPSTRPQFSLAALLATALVIAVTCGLVANMDTSYRISIRCQSLPADDHGLAEWFRRQEGVQSVTTSRVGQTVTVEYAKRHGSYELLAPPLEKLNYLGLQSMSSTISKPSLIGGARIWVSRVPAWLWFAVAVVLAVLLAGKILRGVPGICGVKSDQPESQREV